MESSELEAQLENFEVTSIKVYIITRRSMLINVRNIPRNLPLF